MIFFGCWKCTFSYPQVWDWPLVLGDDAELPSADTNIFALELHKFHSSNQTITTVQKFWYCGIIQRYQINHWQHVTIVSAANRPPHKNSSWASIKSWRLTFEHRGGSFSYDGDHQQIFHRHLYCDGVLVTPQRVRSETYAVFATHAGCNHATVTGESPWGNTHLKNLGRDPTERKDTGEDLPRPTEKTEAVGGTTRTCWLTDVMFLSSSVAFNWTDFYFFLWMIGPREGNESLPHRPGRGRSQ